MPYVGRSFMSLQNQFVKQFLNEFGCIVGLYRYVWILRSKDHSRHPDSVLQTRSTSFVLANVVSGVLGICAPGLQDC